jgi:phospholipid/cholesterol/gamma-HCH transport system substrate-binding protein
MTQSPVRDTLVGLFVLSGLAAIAYLSFSLGGETYRGPGGLLVFATFDEIGGLKSRSQVVIGGVKVGQVTAIQLDEDLRARVSLDLDKRLELPTDTSASILTSGVLGDQYVALEPGAEEAYLQPRDEIEFTQDAVILERMIGKMVQNLGVNSSE